MPEPSGPNKLEPGEKAARRGDDRLLQSARGVLDGHTGKGFIRRFLPFMGPAFIASVAYVDPGNFATNIQGGSEFGYTLLWVVVYANLMAMLVQALSAKLGIATGFNLAEQCRLNYPRPVVFFMWALMELVAMATDLAEFIGAALGFQLLFGFPLWVGGILTAIATFLILGLERYGFRPLEVVISVLVGAVAACYVVELFLADVKWGEALYHAVTPSFSGKGGILLAVGIVGATIMPHAIFLHSSLTQGRIVVKDPAKLKRLFRFEIVDVTVAMLAAGLVNAAMLVTAASTFHGRASVAGIEGAYLTLDGVLGPLARTVFGLSLLASGLSSSSVGTMAGQVIMRGFIRRHIAPWLRRLITMAPSLAVISAGFDPTRALVLSQVALSFGLPFTIVPLVHFTASRKIMGDQLVNSRFTSVLSALVAALVVSLNLYLVFQTLFGG